MPKPEKRNLPVRRPEQHLASLKKIRNEELAEHLWKTIDKISFPSYKELLLKNIEAIPKIKRILDKTFESIGMKLELTVEEEGQLILDVFEHLSISEIHTGMLYQQYELKLPNGSSIHIDVLDFKSQLNHPIK